MKEVANQLVLEIQQEVLDRLLSKLRPEVIKLEELKDSSYFAMKDGFDNHDVGKYPSLRYAYDCAWESWNAFVNVVNIIENFEL